MLNITQWRKVWSYTQNGGPATNRSLHDANRELSWLQDQVRDYPVCLDIGDDDDPDAFRIVHAEQPFSWSEAEFQALFRTSDFIEVGESRLLWGRYDLEDILFDFIPRLHPERSKRRTFCGHTSIEEITETHNTFWIDTFEASTLSCIDTVTLEAWSVVANGDEMPE